MNISSIEFLRGMFSKYPDVMDVKQVSRLLDVSTKTVYKIIRDGSLTSLKVGREFRIPKVNVMRYVKVFGVDEISAKE